MLPSSLTPEQDSNIFKLFILGHWDSPLAQKGKPFLVENYTFQLGCANYHLFISFPTRHPWVWTSQVHTKTPAEFVDCLLKRDRRQLHWQWLWKETVVSWKLHLSVQGQVDKGQMTQW